MTAMFYDASAFNRDIGKWDVGQVRKMDLTFTNAAAFDRDISAWAVGNVTSALDMLNSCPIREAHMPHTGLAVRGPRATELRSELTRIIGEIGLSQMSVVCVDTGTGPIRVSLNRSIIGAAAVKLAPSSPNAAREIRAKVQDKLLRRICGFYGWPGPEVPEAPKGPGKGPVPVTVQFNWTAPLDRPRPWTWTCGSTKSPEPLEKPDPLDPERSKCTVS
jgi:surface protein